MSKKDSSNFSFKGVALSASTDMLAGIVVGAGLGVAIDKYFEIYPWGLIVGFLLGAAAGLLNVYRGLCKIGYGFNRKRSGQKDIDG